MVLRIKPDKVSLDLQGFVQAKFVICLTFSECGDLITGDSNGTIYIWGDAGSKITNYVKHAHDVLIIPYLS